MTTNPLAYLRAAHSAAQARAEAAAERAWSPHWEYDGSVHEIRDLNNGNELAVIYHPEIGAHVEANDPHAVLRRIDRDREILAMWQDPEKVRNPPEGTHDGRDPDEIEAQVAAAQAINDVVRLIAEGWGWKEDE